MSKINIDDIKPGYTIGNADAAILRDELRELAAYRGAQGKVDSWRTWPEGDYSQGFIVDDDEDPAHKPGECDAQGVRWLSKPLYTAPTLPAAPDDIRMLQIEIEIWKDRLSSLQELFREIANELGCDVKNNEEMISKINVMKAGGISLPAQKDENHLPDTGNMVKPKDHVFREMVNALREVAKKYHNTEQLRDQIAHVFFDAIPQLFANSERLNYPVIPVSWLSIPETPSLAHLNSIAMRLRHDFGLMTVDQKESMRAQARQMYEECSGQGFFTIKKEPVPEGWTGNASADLALTLLGRLDSSVEDDDRISQIEQIIRGLVRDE